jgi:hypothetical protein
VVIDFNKFATVTLISFEETGKALIGEIFVDNAASGQFTPKLMKLRHGLHTLEVRRQGFKAEALLINIEENIDEPLRFIFRKVDVINQN